MRENVDESEMLEMRLATFCASVTPVYLFFFVIGRVLTRLDSQFPLSVIA